MRLSEKFIFRLACYPLPKYKVALSENLDPGAFYKMTLGIRKVNEDDIRLIRIGRRLGLKPSEIFEEIKGENKN